MERPLFRQYEVLIYQLLIPDIYGNNHFMRLSQELFIEVVERLGRRIEEEEEDTIS